MSSVALAQPCTYRDLVALPDDGLRHELLDGEHVVSPSPGTSHQLISRRLSLILGAYVNAHQLGQVLHAPYDIKLSMITVLVPDLVFFTTERFARVVNEKHATAAPDLVVEILSPGTRRRDKGRKRAIYEREGVREVLDRGSRVRRGHHVDAAGERGRVHGRHDPGGEARRRAGVAAVPGPGHSARPDLRLKPEAWSPKPKPASRAPDSYPRAQCPGATSRRVRRVEPRRIEHDPRRRPELRRRGDSSARV